MTRSNSSGITRRGLLKAAGALGAATALGACNTSPNTGGGNGAGQGGGNGGGNGGSGGESGKIAWWDFSESMRSVNERIFKKIESETGTPVEYTFQQIEQIGEALQLAKQSEQLPDVFTPAGLELPTSVLIQEGWYHPIELDDDAKGRIPEGALVEGVHTFDGKIYNVPIFNDRQYWAPTWFNKEMLAKAEVEPPETYEEFRDAAKAVQEKVGGNTSGWIFNLGDAARVELQVNSLAQAAGFEGMGGVLFKTGDVAYDDEAYLTVIEFLLSLQQDGLMFPGSANLNDKDARTRWYAGGAAFFFDGPWCAGVIKAEADEFSEQLDIAPMLVPDSGMEVSAYAGPGPGYYYIAATSKNVEVVSQLLGYQTEEQYNIDIATSMEKAPLDWSAVDKSDAHPAWKKLMGWYKEQAFLAPTPVVKNPDVEQVNILAKPIAPTMGDIVQGALGGDVKDYAKALKDLSDKTMKQREENVKTAKGKGAKVELDDWAFPSWQPREDFTPDMYGA